MTDEYERYSFWHTELKACAKKEIATLSQFDLELIETDTNPLEIIDDEQAIYI